jgi:hypothetical protein
LVFQLHSNFVTEDFSLDKKLKGRDLFLFPFVDFAASLRSFVLAFGVAFAAVFSVVSAAPNRLSPYRCVLGDAAIPIVLIAEPP